jgi:hypothetical protein
MKAPRQQGAENARIVGGTVGPEAANSQAPEIRGNGRTRNGERETIERGTIERGTIERKGEREASKGK